MTAQGKPLFTITEQIMDNKDPCRVIGIGAWK